MSDITFGIRLTADGSGYVGTVRLATQETEKLGAAARQAGKEVEAAQKESLAGAIALGTAIGNIAVEAVKGFGRWAAETVTAAAELKNLRDITGSSVEDLSRLSNIAKVSGTEASAFADVIGRLAVRLSGADAESDKAGKALAALGIQARDPAKAMQELADKFSGYADDANKAAYAQAIFGRGGEKLLPLLKDIAEQQGIVATTTTKQAEEAERLEKSIRTLTAQASLFRDELLEGVVPALTAFFKALRGETVTDKLALFSISPEDRKDLETAITQTKVALAEVTKLRNALANPGPGVFGAVAAWLSSDDLAIANKQLDAMEARLKGLTALANQLNPDRGIHKNADRYLPAESLGAPPGGDGAKKSVADFTSAINSLQEQLDKLTGADGGMTHLNKALKDIAAAGAAGHPVIKAQADAYKAIAADLDKATLANKLWNDAMKNAEEQAKREQHALEEWNKAILEAAKHYTDFYASLQDSVDKANEEVAAIGLSAGAQRDLAAIHQIDIELRKTLNKLTADGAEDMRSAAIAAADEAKASIIAANAAGDAARAWHDTLTSVTEGASNFFVDLFNNGSKAFKNLWENFKQLAFRALADIAAKQVVVSIVGALGIGGTAGAQAASGLAASGGGLGQLANIGSLGNTASSLYGIGSAAVGAYTAGAAGINAAAIGASEAALFGGVGAGAAVGAGGVGAGLSAGLAAGLAAVPVAGWVALAGLVVYGIYKGLDKGPANRTATFASGAASLVPDASRDAVFQGKSAFGAFGIAKDFWLGPEAGSAFKPTLDAITKLDDTISQMVGGDLTKQITEALAQHSVTVGFGKEGSDINASGGPGAILKDRYITVLNTIDARLGEMVQSFQGTGEELANFVVGLVSLKTALGEGFDRLQSSDIAALGDAFGGIDKLASSLSFLNTNFKTEAAQFAETQGKLAADFAALGVQLPATHQGFLDLLSSFDLTTADGRRLYAAVMGLSGAFVEVNGTATQAAAALRESFSSLDAAISAFKGDAGGGAQSQLSGLITQLISSTGNTGFTQLRSQLGDVGFAQNLSNISHEDFARYSRENQALITEILNVGAQAKQQTGGGGLSLGADYYKQVFGFDGSEATAVVDDTLEALKRLRQGILDYVDGLKIGSLSPLTPLQKLEEARQQYQSTLGKAQGGDQAALGSITQSSDAYLKQSRDFYASSAAYTEIFNTVTDQLTRLGGGEVGASSPADAALISVLPKGSTLASAADIEAFSRFMVSVLPAAPRAPNSSAANGNAGADLVDAVVTTISDWQQKLIASADANAEKIVSSLQNVKNTIAEQSFGTK